MRYVILIVAGVLLLPLSFASAQDDDAVCANPLRIATWNIENFSFARLEDAETAETVVATWDLIDADVVALQEIASQEVIDGLLEQVNAVTGRHYQATLSTRGGGSQKVGFAWDSETITVLREAEPIDSLRLRGTRLRPGFTADFAFDDYDVTLVTLHLKATQEQPSQRIREAQSLLLAEWYTERGADADQDIIILGDYNDFLDAEPLQPVTDLFFMATGDLPAETASYIGVEFRSLIDHVALSTGTGAHDDYCMIEVFDPALLDLTEAEFELLASDHVPVIVTMNADLVEMQDTVSGS